MNGFNEKELTINRPVVFKKQDDKAKLKEFCEKHNIQFDIDHCVMSPIVAIEMLKSTYGIKNDTTTDNTQTQDEVKKYEKLGMENKYSPSKPYLKMVSHK